MDKITLKSGTIYQREDGILEFDIAHNIEIDEECAKDLVNAADILTEQRKPLYIKSEPHSLSFEAMQILSQATTITAAAMFVSSRTQEQTGDFFVNSMQPAYPMKIFFSEDEALQWLEKFK